MIIKNYTPHTIHVYAEASLIKHPKGWLTPKDGVTPVVSFPSEGVARVNTEDWNIGTFEIDGAEIPVYNTEYTNLVGLPEREDDVVLIVSAVLAEAADRKGRDTTDLYFPTHLVRDDEGRIIGCAGLTSRW